MSNQTMAVVVIVIILAVAGIFAFNSLLQPTPNKSTETTVLAPGIILASISFQMNFPTALIPGSGVPLTVSVANTGHGDAWNVTIHDDSSVLAISASSLNVSSSSSGVLRSNIVAQDVQDGGYTANVWLAYSDAEGQHNTPQQNVPFHLVPLLAFKHVTTWGDPWPQPTGKDDYHPADSGYLFFNIVSMSHYVVYSGMTVRASWSIPGPGFTVTPQMQTIAPLGPQGTSPRYNVTLNSNDTPNGVYTLQLSLYSANGDLISQTTYTFTVKS